MAKVRKKYKPKNLSLAVRACNGSGYYDSGNSPYCGACNGSGKETYKPKL